jgi:hypothetical protein
MSINLHLAALVIAVPLLQSVPLSDNTRRATLVEARNLAYDANFRNDQAGLRAAVEALQPLAKSGDDRAYAHYYLWWTYWALSSSQVQEKNMSGALESGKAGVQHARDGLALRPSDPEFHSALANALIVVGFLDGAQFKSVMEELMAARAKALALGPRNPRVLLLDAGMIFNMPPASGGSKEKGLERWREALRQFEIEAGERTIDPIAPRWGYALAQGWLATLHLRMEPPQKEQARAAADAALRMRPDFWWVRDQVLPQLRE